MRIHTINEDYEYRMRNIITNFLKSYPELQELSPDELRDEIWDKRYAIEFGRAVLDDMTEFADDELFGGAK